MSVVNDFWALGPNVTGWPGGYPNGFLERCRAERIWGQRRLHVCSGTVQDGVTLDISREPKGKADVRPVVQGEAAALPFKASSFDLLLADPPYSRDHAEALYDVPLVSVDSILREGARVLRPGGLAGVLDWRVWPPPRGGALALRAIIAVYTANPGPKPLRAFTVYRRREAPLEAFDAQPG